MAKAFVVRQPFTRVNPLTGAKQLHFKGEMIKERERVADIEASDHAHHVVPVTVPDEPAPQPDAAAAEALDHDHARWAEDGGPHPEAH